MKVNIFHYHLNPGGVTRIIESQILALMSGANAPEIRLFCGGCDDETPFRKLGVEPVVFKPLNYLFPPAEETKEIEKITKEIEGFIQDNTDRSDVFHVHNLNLGKNPCFTVVFSALAGKGYKVVNHAHDFAEDRPQNIQFLEEVISGKLDLDLQEIMYPGLKNYLFATLNDFDLNRLGDYGVPDSRRFILPNPVIFDDKGQLPDRKSSRDKVVETLSLDREKLIVTYPVRVIERKNIGELILLAVLFNEKASWLVTLPPQNPVEVEKYSQWKEFIKDEDIDVRFEVGKQMDFITLLRGSDFCVSTSYKEGFGMVYLEPWTMGTPVAGRDISYLTSDFRREGLQFNNLYERIAIPGRPEDFAEIPAEEQRKVIQKIKHSADFRKDVMDENPRLKTFLDGVSKEEIDRNIEIIREKYSLQQYGERLITIYKAFPGGE